MEPLRGSDFVFIGGNFTPEANQQDGAISNAALKSLNLDNRQNQLPSVITEHDFEEITHKIKDFKDQTVSLYSQLHPDAHPFVVFVGFIKNPQIKIEKMLALRFAGFEEMMGRYLSGPNNLSSKDIVSLLEKYFAVNATHGSEDEVVVKLKQLMDISCWFRGICALFPARKYDLLPAALVDLPELLQLQPSDQESCRQAAEEFQFYMDLQNSEVLPQREKNQIGKQLDKWIQVLQKSTKDNFVQNVVSLHEFISKPAIESKPLEELLKFESKFNQDVRQLQTIYKNLEKRLPTNFELKEFNAQLEKSAIVFDKFYQKFEHLDTGEELVNLYNSEFGQEYIRNLCLMVEYSSPLGDLEEHFAYKFGELLPGVPAYDKNKTATPFIFYQTLTRPMLIFPEFKKEGIQTEFVMKQFTNAVTDLNELIRSKKSDAKLKHLSGRISERFSLVAKLNDEEDVVRKLLVAEEMANLLKNPHIQYRLRSSYSPISLVMGMSPFYYHNIEVLVLDTVKNFLVFLKEDLSGDKTFGSTNVRERLKSSAIQYALDRENEFPDSKPIHQLVEDIQKLID